MDIESLRDFCLTLPRATECMPFDDTTLVFKVEGKMFLFVDLESVPLRFNVKCDPDTVTEWQERYTGIEPAWHMNKQHWLKIVLESDVPRAIIEQLVERAYQLTVTGLSKAKRQELGLE